MPEHDVLSTVLKGKDKTEANKSQGTSAIIKVAVY